jgi:hypothetical protein
MYKSYTIIDHVLTTGQAETKAAGGALRHGGAEELPRGQPAAHGGALQAYAGGYD